MSKYLVAVFLIVFTQNVFSQDSKYIKDSLYIEEVEDSELPVKILHAEPLYIDLIRDLGARKGEQEWNVGLGLTDKRGYDEYEALIEYEWAPVNRLGLEVELPFLFYYPTEGEDVQAPSNKLSSLKLAAQYTFFVSKKLKTSMAIGYLHEFELTDFNNYGNKDVDLYSGNVYNPFFVAAKRWGDHFHTLIYTGPQIIQHFEKDTFTSWEINTNLHYMIPGTRNFIGLEFNKAFVTDDFDMTIRPQMRVEVTEQVMVGLVAGVPISRENERFSTFFRLIYEPKSKH